MVASSLRLSGLVGAAAANLAWLLQPYMPWPLRIVHVALLGLTCWRPSLGVATCAAVSAVGATMAALLDSPLGVGGILVGLALVVVSAALAHKVRPQTKSGPPALSMCAVVFASVASVVVASREIGIPADASLTGSAIIIVGLALAWAAERLTRADLGVRVGAVAGLLVGHSVATLLSVRELIETASRQADPAAAFLTMLTKVRLHSQFDLNAAASTLALVILAGIGLACRRRGWWAWPLLPLPVFGLWLAGSRIALLSLVVVTVAMLAYRVVAGRVRGVVLLAAGAAMIVVGGAGYYALGMTKRNIPIAHSVKSRQILWETGIAMASAAPVTGVGAGRFLELSDDYGSAAIKPVLGSRRTRDNAHNYFIQIAAELGLVGLGVFLWLLIRMWPLPPGWRRLPVESQWLVAGLVACGLTWLTSHPLLEPMAAFPFWLLAGCVAAAGDVDSRRRFTLVITTVIVVLALASVPWQTEGHRDRAELEHVGRNVSRWQPEVDGERYRVGAGGSAVYVPTGSTVYIPVRLAPDRAGPVALSIAVEGRPVNVVQVTADRWTTVELSIRASRRRFVEVSFDAPAGVELWIGRAEARPLR